MSYTIQQSQIRGFEVLCDGVVIGWCLAPWQARKVIADHVNANPIGDYLGFADRPSPWEVSNEAWARCNSDNRWYHVKANPIGE